METEKVLFEVGSFRKTGVVLPVLAMVLERKNLRNFQINCRIRLELEQVPMF